MADEKLPKDIKQICLWYVRGYDRMVRNYLSRRESVIYSSPCPYATYSDGKEECRQYFGHGSIPGNPTESKQEQLEEIEGLPETKRMRSVEQAELSIGDDVQSEEVRQRLRQGVLLNCRSGRKYPFEILNLSEFSRMDFYRRKDRFLIQIAQLSGLI
ncbi:hypothetical protein CAFE_30790 [Caprobacter fermentans]|uniref:Uncharacterized protein n=1 Tax=Caproicibacter fermentans TaxID=2576756 RepID=A0A6N8I354_9FIRM|nr:hypothetical protein [Caproicibacter fermentans]MVB12345.1 hypothetical protein [Caproicibacter fermentans]